MLEKQKLVQEEEAKRFFKCNFTGNRVAIDGGAHVGSWSVLMARYFFRVYAFEPCTESFESLQKNTSEYANITRVKWALGDRYQDVESYAPKGRTTLTARRVRPGKGGLMMPLDQFGLDACDFVKFDLEGYELKALRGAEQTIRKFSPYLVIEMNEEKPVLEFLSKFGYKEQWRDGVDRGFAK